MNVNLSDNTQLIVTFNNQAEKALLNTGYDNLSTDDKNSLIAIIAHKENKAFTDITPDYILQYHKNLKTDYVNDMCNLTIVQGFTSTNGHKYTLDLVDQMNMFGQKDKLRDDPSITSVDWKAEDVGDWIPHTRDEWLNQVYGEGYTFVEQQRQHAKELKKTIKEALDHPALINIKW